MVGRKTVQSHGGSVGPPTPIVGRVIDASVKGANDVTALQHCLGHVKTGVLDSQLVDPESCRLSKKTENGRQLRKFRSWELVPRRNQ